MEYKSLLKGECVMDDNQKQNKEKLDAQISLKATQTVKDRFSSISVKLIENEPGISQSDVMAQILDIAEVGLARTSHLVSAKAIKELDYHSSRMANIYMNIINQAEAFEKEHKENYTELEGSLKEKEKVWSDKNVELVEKNRMKNETIEDLSKNNAALEHQKREVEGHLGDKDRIIEALEEKNKEYLSTKEDLKLAEAENDLHSKKIRALEKQVAESNHVNVGQADTIKRVNDDLTELKGEFKELKDEKKNLSERIQGYEKEIAELLKNQNEMHLELETCNVKHVTTIEQRDFFKIEVENLKDERKSHRLEVARLLKENADLRIEKNSN